MRFRGVKWPSKVTVSKQVADLGLEPRCPDLRICALISVLLSPEFGGFAHISSASFCKWTWKELSCFLFPGHYCLKFFLDRKKKNFSFHLSCTKYLLALGFPLSSIQAFCIISLSDILHSAFYIYHWYLQYHASIGYSLFQK